ncbi:hypothetical protein GCM10027053_09620 [Intrasporangium mesophilum]
MNDSARAALAKLRHDLARGTPIELDVLDEQAVDSGVDDSFWLLGTHGTRTGVIVPKSLEPGPLLASIAGQVQDFLHEELPGRSLPALWPECPTHPRSHPLSPDAANDSAAVWLCPLNNQVIAEIGLL